MAVRRAGSTRKGLEVVTDPEALEHLVGTPTYWLIRLLGVTEAVFPSSFVSGPTGVV